jgi:hypothetical protein
MELSLLLWVACIILGGVIGSSKGDLVRGLVWTILIGPVGLIVVLASPAKDAAPRSSRTAPGGDLEPEASPTRRTDSPQPRPSNASRVLLVVGGCVLAASLAVYVVGMNTTQVGGEIGMLFSVSGAGLGLVLLAAGVIGGIQGRR